MVRYGQTLRFKVQKEEQWARSREPGIPGLHEHIFVQDMVPPSASLSPICSATSKKAVTPKGTEEA